MIMVMVMIIIMVCLIQRTWCIPRKVEFDS